eukprot:scaffold157285_cov18-Tisochrysis_lutea.AAC.1
MAAPNKACSLLMSSNGKRGLIYNTSTCTWSCSGQAVFIASKDIGTLTSGLVALLNNTQWTCLTKSPGFYEGHLLFETAMVCIFSMPTWELHWNSAFWNKDQSCAFQQDLCLYELLNTLSKPLNPCNGLRVQHANMGVALKQRFLKQRSILHCPAGPLLYELLNTLVIYYPVLGLCALYLAT